MGRIPGALGSLSSGKFAGTICACNCGGRMAEVVFQGGSTRQPGKPTDNTGISKTALSAHAQIRCLSAAPARRSKWVAVIAIMMTAAPLTALSSRTG
jgi:hypothetical protein